MAFDFGLRQIGVAVGNAMLGTSRPLPVLRAREGSPDWAAVAALNGPHDFIADNNQAFVRRRNLVVEALMSQANAPPSFTADQKQKMALMRAGFKELVRLARKYKLKIAFGSDVFLSKEAYALQSQEWIARDPFFTPFENLKSATGIGGELLALSGPRNRYRDGPLGVIRKGAYADLLLIDGNPLEDIKILADPENNIDLIMKDGVIYKNEI